MKMVRSDLAASGRHLHARHRDRASATWCSSPAPTASARTSSRAPSIPTSSTSTSRPSGRATAPCCGARSAARQITDGLRRGRHRASTRNVPTAGGATGSASASATRRSWRSPIGAAHRGALRRSAGAPARWTSSGRRTASTASSTSCRPGRRRWRRSARATELETLRRLTATAPVLSAAAAPSASKIATGRGARHRGHRASSAAVPARRGPGRRHHRARTGSR